MKPEQRKSGRAGVKVDSAATALRAEGRATGGDRTSLATQAYDEIRSRILNAQLAPASLVSEYQLAAELGLSRTPVREALKRLEREGLVESAAGRGSYVSELSFQDILEIYEVRLLLEPFAAGVAAKQLSREDISALQMDVVAARRAAASGKVDDVFRLDIRLHKTLVATTRNGRIADILGRLDDQVHRIRVMAPRIAGRQEATIREHEAIVHAIAAHDQEGAEHAMRDHLLAARANAIQLAVPMPFERESRLRPMLLAEGKESEAR